MAASRVQIILGTADNVPANFVTNNFAIEYATRPDGTDIQAAFKAAYDVIGQGNWSNEMRQNDHGIKITEFGGTPPLYPWYEGDWNMAAIPNGPALPAEVATVLSFQGAKVSGLTQKRRRGRIYFGKLSTATMASGRPGATFIGEMVDFAETLSAGLLAMTSEPATWSVYSPTDQDTVQIVDGWVDNEYDTQRRRGRDATSRTLFTL